MIELKRKSGILLHGTKEIYGKLLVMMVSLLVLLILFGAEMESVYGAEMEDKSLIGTYEIDFGDSGGVELIVTPSNDAFEGRYFAFFSGSLGMYAGYSEGFIVATTDGTDGLYDYYDNNKYETTGEPSLQLQFDGGDELVITSLDKDTFGGLGFPGFSGTYDRKAEAAVQTYFGYGMGYANINGLESMLISLIEPYYIWLDSVDAQVNRLEYGETTQDNIATSAEGLAIWDEALNRLYDEIMSKLSQEDAEEFRNLQRDWIYMRDQSAMYASEEFAGGSMASLIYSETLLTETRIRCYDMLLIYARLLSDGQQISSAGMLQLGDIIDVIYEGESGNRMMIFNQDSQTYVTITNESMAYVGVATLITPTELVDLAIRFESIEGSDRSGTVEVSWMGWESVDFPNVYSSDIPEFEEYYFYYGVYEE